MKKNFKCIISIILCLLFTIQSTSLPIFAQESDEEVVDVQQEELNEEEVESEDEIVEEDEIESEETTQQEDIEEPKEQVEEEIEQPQEEEMIEEVEGDSSLIEYFVVEYPYLSAPQTQKMIFSMSNESFVCDSMYIMLQREGEFEAEKIECSNRVNKLCEFTKDFTALDTGEYTVLELHYILDNKDYVIHFGSVGMDIRFGVNKEYDGYDHLVSLENVEDTVAAEELDNVASITSENITEIETIVSDTIEQASQDSGVTGVSYSVSYMSDKAKAKSLKTSAGVLQMADTNVITIGIDPGHGGTDSGAVGINGVYEKDLNLKIAKYAKAELSKYPDCNVVMSRTKDVTIDSLYDRCKILVDKGADVVISFHLNASGGSGYGVEVYYPNSHYLPRTNAEGKVLAQQIQNELSALGIYDRGIKTRTIDGHDDLYDYPNGSTGDYYGIIRHSKNLGVTGIIIEHCFIDNYSDYVNYLSTDAKLKQLAIADVAGIARAYGLNGGTPLVENPALSFKQPTLDGLANTSSGIAVHYTGCAKATEYIIYRKEDGVWFEFDRTTDTVYTDTTVEAGQTYSYTVACTDGKKTTDYDEAGLSLTYIGTPSLGSVINAVDGITVTWNSTAAAESYAVLRKNGDGSYKTIAKGLTSLSYTDTTAVSGTKYTYTVRAYIGNIYSGSQTGLSKTRLDVPAIRSISNVNTGVCIKWDEVTGATGYYVIREDGAKYTTSTTSYTDTDVIGKNTYTYYVKAYYGNTTSSSNAERKSIIYVPTPVLKEAKNLAAGIEVSWDEVDGATSYSIYRKVGTSSWSKLTTTTSTQYVDIDVDAAVSYTYSILATYNDSKSSYDKTGVSVIRVTQPYISSMSNRASGVYLKWSAVEGATSYIVYALEDGAWSSVGKTSSTSFITSGCESGKTYRYSVRAVNQNSYSSMQAATPILYVGTPELNVVANKEAGILFSWKAVDQAESYTVLRKQGTGSYQVIATGLTELSYLDTATEDGISYTYTVKAVIGSSVSSYYSAGKTKARLSIPTIKSITNVSSGLTIKWNKVEGSTGTYLYRWNGSKWDKIQTTTSTSYTDTMAGVEGATYKYMTKAYIGSTTSTSDYKGKSQIRLLAPTLSAVANKENGLLFTWKKSEGASTYTVLRKSEDGKYVKVAEGLTTCKYLDTDVVSGKTYTYTVYSNKDSAKSTYDTTGKSKIRLGIPTISSITNASKGLTVKWKEVTGAKGYYLYRWNGSKWEKILTTTSTSYTDTMAGISGATYTYMTKAYNGSTTSTSDYEGMSQVRLLAPSSLSGTLQSDGVHLKWSSVKGATSYKVYRKINGTYTLITETTNLTYIDTSSTAKQNYYYMVRSMKDSIKGYYKTCTVEGLNGYPIMGSSNCTVSQMVSYYKANNSTYDKFSKYGTTYDGCLKRGGASTIEQFCQIFYEEALAEGVNAEVAFCQAMKETGFLKYGGDVKPDQYNYAGLGATGNGVPGNSFSSVRIGIRAQIQHLKAYASTEPLNNECVDVRFTYVTRGCAPTVEELGAKWAVGSNYGNEIVQMISTLQSY